MKDLLSGRLQVDHYDLVYSAGLFDYLPDRVCIALLTCLKNLLAPNATLLVANFLEGIGDRGYMECCMDWWLTYRTEDSMRALGLAAGLHPEISLDSGNQIVYMSHRHRPTSTAS